MKLGGSDIRRIAGRNAATACFPQWVWIADLRQRHRGDGVAPKPARRWHLRDNRLTHRVFRTTEDIINGCCDAWNWLLSETGRIRSLCSYPWLAQVST